MTDHERATPRPWHWDGSTLAGTTDNDDHVITGHVCDSCEKRGHYCLSGRDANRDLIVEAVNNYDRLLRIEAAARGIFIGWTPEGDGYYDALRAALSEPSS